MTIIDVHKETNRFSVLNAPRMLQNGKWESTLLRKTKKKSIDCSRLSFSHRTKT